MGKSLSTEEVRARLQAAYYNLDIYTEVEKHTSTRLYPARNGKQANGACPYDDCLADENGFIVWRELTDKDCHFYCRQCRRGGDIVKLVRDTNGWTFAQACQALGIPNPYQEDGDETFNRALIRREVKKQDAPSADWQLLQDIYPRACLALKNHARALAYLAERAIPLDIAVEHGLGYIPPLADIKLTPELERIKKWCDRVIFPLETPDGRRGFTGRALALWSPGMDENSHKDKMDAAKINRYEKTYPAGYFNWQTIAGREHVYVVEGLFDALAIMAGGISGVVALAGTSLRVRDVPKHLEMIDVCLDADDSGKSSARQLYKDLYRAGYEVRSFAPDTGKDWSEAYRLRGAEGLTPLLEVDRQRQAVELPEQQAEHQSEPAAPDLADMPEVCGDCGAHIGREDRDFFYLPGSLDGQVRCFCDRCRNPETGEQREQTPEPDHTVNNINGSEQRDQGDQEPARKLSPDELAAWCARELPGWRVEVVPAGSPLVPMASRRPAEITQKQRPARPQEDEQARKQRETREAEHRAFLDAQALSPRVYPVPFPAYSVVDGKLEQVGMHGRNPGEYWTMAEWTPPAPALSVETTPLVVPVPAAEDELGKLKAEFKAYCKPYARLFWNGDMPGGYANGFVSRKEYLKRLSTCLESGKEMLVSAAIRNMRVLVYGKDELRK